MNLNLKMQAKNVDLFSFGYIAGSLLTSLPVERERAQIKLRDAQEHTWYIY